MLQINKRSRSLSSKAKNKQEPKYLRKKSLFLDSLTNNAEKALVNPNTIKNIKDKLENPFKMPKQNEEIFEIRDILQKEVDYLKILNQNKYKNKKIKAGHNLNPYPTETNEDFFNQNYNNFIDKFKTFVQINIEKNNEIDMGATEIQSTNDAKVLQSISHKKLEDEKKELNDEKKVLLQKKIESIGGHKRDNVRDYINKTREIVFMKYTIDMKKERAVRIKETYQNELESIKDSILSMQEAKKMFEKEFYEKFEKYVKYLTNQKEKEKAEEINLLETKVKLESDKKRLITKIKKIEDNKEKLEEYRDFLICVKEKKLKLPEFYKRIQGQLTTDPNKNTHEPKRGQGHPNTTYLTAIVEPDNESHRGKSREKRSHNNEAEDPIKKYQNSQIFNSLSELIDEIKKMQNDNVTKLSQYNEVVQALNEAQKNITIMRENDKNNYTYIVRDINTKENQLKEIKDRNKKLNEERNLLLDGGKGETAKSRFKDKSNITRKSIVMMSVIKNKFFQPILFARIYEVYKSTRELDFSNNSIDKILNINDSGRDALMEVERKMLLMLQYIERALDILLEKKNYFKVNKNKEFLQLASILEEERKIKKTVDQKLVDQMRNEHKIKDIMDRDKKIQKLPQRILPERYLPIERNKKEKKDNKHDKKDLTFEDLINFG